MTVNQRRTGLRLPWTSHEGDREDEAAPAPEGAADAPARPSDPPKTSSGEPDPSATGAPAPDPSAQAAQPVDADVARGGGAAEPSTESAGPPDEFMRGLLEAMRKVADEALQAGLGDVRARSDERIRELESEAEERCKDLGRRADVDVAAVGEWARAEAERIKAEAERRVSARRTQLEEQLAADAKRAESETKGVRDLVNAYERELEAYHAQLAELTDPAAFAAAAKRIPRPPALRTPTSGTVPGASTAEPVASPAIHSPAAAESEATVATATNNGVDSKPGHVHSAEEEVLEARLAMLNATLPAEPASDVASPASTDPVMTEVVVTGLGSFGAITSFRQSLAAVDGVDGVTLSLGPSGEFIFRTTHRAGFDVRDAITALEGDAAAVQPRDAGGYLVKLERAR